MIAGAIFVVGWRRFRETRRRVRGRTLRAEQVSKQLLLLAAATTVLLLVMPLVVHFLSTAIPIDQTESAEMTQWRTQRVLVGLALVALALCLGGIAIWLLQRRLLRTLRGVLAAVGGASVLLVPFTLSTQTGATLTWSFERDGITLIIATVIILLFG